MLRPTEVMLKDYSKIIICVVTVVVYSSSEILTSRLPNNKKAKEMIPPCPFLVLCVLLSRRSLFGRRESSDAADGFPDSATPARSTMAVKLGFGPKRNGLAELTILEGKQSCSRQKSDSWSDIGFDGSMSNTCAVDNGYALTLGQKTSTGEYVMTSEMGIHPPGAAGAAAGLRADGLYLHIPNRKDGSMPPEQRNNGDWADDGNHGDAIYWTAAGSGRPANNCQHTPRSPAQYGADNGDGADLSTWAAGGEYDSVENVLNEGADDGMYSGIAAGVHPGMNSYMSRSPSPGYSAPTGMPIANASMPSSMPGLDQTANSYTKSPSSTGYCAPAEMPTTNASTPSPATRSSCPPADASVSPGYALNMPQQQQYGHDQYSVPNQAHSQQHIGRQTHELGNAEQHALGNAEQHALGNAEQQPEYSVPHRQQQQQQQYHYHTGLDAPHTAHGAIVDTRYSGVCVAVTQPDGTQHLARSHSFAPGPHTDGTQHLARSHSFAPGPHTDGTQHLARSHSFAPGPHTDGTELLARSHSFAPDSHTDSTEHLARSHSFATGPHTDGTQHLARSHSFAPGPHTDGTQHMARSRSFATDAHRRYISSTGGGIVETDAATLDAASWASHGNIVTEMEDKEYEALTPQQVEVFAARNTSTRRASASRQSSVQPVEIEIQEVGDESYEALTPEQMATSSVRNTSVRRGKASRQASATTEVTLHGDSTGASRQATAEAAEVTPLQDKEYEALTPQQMAAFSAHSPSTKRGKASRMSARQVSVKPAEAVEAAEVTMLGDKEYEALTPQQMAAFSAHSPSTKRGKASRMSARQQLNCFS